MTVRHGQAGNFVCIVAGIRPGLIPLYWTGKFKDVELPTYSINHADAAQFVTTEEAEFTAKMMGLPGRWHLEMHGWD